MKKHDLGFGNGFLILRGKNWYHRYLGDGRWIVKVVKDESGKSVQSKDKAYGIIMKEIEKKTFLNQLSKEQIDLQLERNRRTITKHDFKADELWSRYENSMNRPDSGKETIRSLN